MKKSREEKRQEKIKEAKKEYFKKFNKDNIPEGEEFNIIMNCLFQVECIYTYRSVDQVRYLAALETMLVLKGVLEGGGKFNLKEKKKKFIFWTYIEQESYKELILRHTKEYLRSLNIL